MNWCNTCNAQQLGHWFCVSIPLFLLILHVCVQSVLSVEVICILTSYDYSQQQLFQAVATIFLTQVRQGWIAYLQIMILSEVVCFISSQNTT